MAVKRDYFCKGHGVWETTDKIVEKCPYGCTQFERYFSQPPGYIGVRTRNSDRMQRDIASQFGLTDMSNRNGDSLKANEAKRYPRTAATFALPATELSKPGTPKEQKKSLSIGNVLASAPTFDGTHTPTNVDSAFARAKEATAGTRRTLTDVFAACDKDGNRVAPG